MHTWPLLGQGGIGGEEAALLSAPNHHEMNFGSPGLQTDGTLYTKHNGTVKPVLNNHPMM